MNIVDKDILISVRNETDEAVGGHPVTFTGSKTVYASVYEGVIALFCDGIDGHLWNITHIPTGLRMREIYGTREKAEEIIHKLLTVDWQFGKFGSQESLMEMNEETKKVFLDVWKQSEPLASPAASLGRKGGQARTEAKVHASRSNGQKGGRPKQERDTSAFD